MNQDQETALLEILEAAVEAAAEELALLDAERGQELVVLDRTMRGRLTCPVCAGRKLLHATEIVDRAEGFLRPGMAIEQHKWWGDLEGTGLFEAWICTSCGLVEWYVPDLSKVKVDGSTKRIVEAGDPEAEPGEREPT